MNQRTNHQSGFTLIELMLAMAFVSALLVMVAMTTMQISSIYNRGITLKTVNQAGRDLSDAFRRDVSAARQSDVELVRFSEGGEADLNRLCLGNYSYVWNYGREIEDDVAVNYYNDDGADTKRPIGLARLSDPGGRLCKADDDNNYPQIKQSAATEMLARDATSKELALHEFDFGVLASDSSVSQAVYSLSFTLGTNDQSVLESGRQCTPPSGESNIEFCAVNKFEMAIRANGV